MPGFVHNVAIKLATAIAVPVALSLLALPIQLALPIEVDVHGWHFRLDAESKARPLPAPVEYSGSILGLLLRAWEDPVSTTPQPIPVPNEKKEPSTLPVMPQPLPPVVPDPPIGTPAVATVDISGAFDLLGSTMLLVVKGDDVTITYIAPRLGLQQQGVRDGTLYFSGRKNGNDISGTANRYHKYCGDGENPGRAPFHVDGTISSDGGTISMWGHLSEFDRNCEPYEQAGEPAHFELNRKI